MTFQEATACLDGGKWVRRACWEHENDFLARPESWGGFFFRSEEPGVYRFRLHVLGGHHCTASLAAWSPGDDDASATDWELADRPSWLDGD